MSIQMPVKEFLIMHHRGNETNDECPKCGSTIYAGQNNIRWCVNPECTWSNDKDTEIWLRSRKGEEVDD